MGAELWIALFILLAAIVLFVTEWIRVDVVALGVVVALMLSGLLTPEEALSGFSNPAVLTIAALFVVGGALLQTGLAGVIGSRILAVAGGRETRLTLVLMSAVGLLSALMSDTGTVAVLLPAVVILARTARISPSRLMIPLSFGALLGGATTLIGTPPNIIVTNLLREEGLRSFEFFSFTPMGLLLLTAGVLFMLTAGRHLLPDRQVTQESQRVETPKELVDLYRLPQNLFQLRVRKSSNLIGKTLAQSRLRQDFSLSVLEILRPPESRPSLPFGEARGTPSYKDRISLHPEPDARLQHDDLLIVQGEPEDVSEAIAAWNLGLQAVSTEEGESLISQEVGIAEVLLPPRSSLLGKTLVQLRFGTTYKLTVLGLQRPGVDEKLDLKETPLRFGDTLLVLGPWKNILALKERPRDFVVTGQPSSMVPTADWRKMAIAAATLVGMLIIMVSNLLPLATASMLAALAMVLTGCLSMDEAYQAIDWRSILLIAGMLPMSLALEKVQLVHLVAQGLADSLGLLGPHALMAGLFLLTSAFTQVLSNTATTVLIAPIALASAQGLDLNPHPFMMAVAVAASTAFASPVASPVNTLVMSAGSYRFGDYLKAGLPLILLSLSLALLVLPLLFPF